MLLGALTAASVIATSLDRGGFTDASQKLLLVLVGAALLVTLLAEPEAVLDGIRSPLVCSLLALGGVTMFSGLWTQGAPASAIRWGLVVLAYASLVVCGHAVVRQGGIWAIAAPIACLAVLEAAMGCTSAALHSGRWAILIDGSWRPSGSFEYPPALALLELTALPAFLRLATSDAREPASLGVAGLGVAGVTIGCTDSRTALFLLAAVLVAFAAWPAGDRAARHAVVAAAGVVGVAVLIGALLIGRHTSAGEGGSGAAIRLAGASVAIAAAAALWTPLRALAATVDLKRLATAVLLAAGVGAVAWLMLGYTSTLTSLGGGLGHGRISYWTAAFDAWKQKPILGFGANTFYLASVSYQAANDQTIFAHNLLLELAAELGIPGFLAGLAIYLAAAHELRLTARTADALVLAPIVAFFLLDNLVDWPWHLAGLGALWAVAAGGARSARSAQCAQCAQSAASPTSELAQAFAAGRDHEV